MKLHRQICVYVLGTDAVNNGPHIPVTVKKPATTTEPAPTTIEPAAKLTKEKFVHDELGIKDDAKALTDPGQLAKAKELNAEFATYDADGSGDLSDAEFQKLVQDRKSASEEQRRPTVSNNDPNFLPMRTAGTPTGKDAGAEARDATLGGANEPPGDKDAQTLAGYAKRQGEGGKAVNPAEGGMGRYVGLNPADGKDARAGGANLQDHPKARAPKAGDQPPAPGANQLGAETEA